MRILELRFKNLNSLYGEWVIDFTAPEYTANGIFALTGPTGAGKSTILDAICLALYGATPRLNRITGDANELMSRQTGECFSEVLFESQAGRFRCFWAQHRARKKAAGKLANSRHEISDENTGKILESKKSLVAAVIEEKTGMDFDRFTRSMLLAQGGFDTFLKADTEEKSKILEQITGTEIYSKISIQVHEIQKAAREKYNFLTAELAGITILNPEQEKEFQADLGAKTKQEIELNKQYTEVDKALRWLTAVAGLDQEIKDLTSDTEKLGADMAAFKDQRKILSLARHAAQLEGEFANLTAVRKQLEADKKDLEVTVKKLPDLAAALKLKEAAWKKAAEQSTKVKQELELNSVLINKVRSMDQLLAGLKKEIAKQSESYKEQTTALDAKQKQVLGVQTNLEKAQEKLKTAADYLQLNCHDEWLTAGLAGIEAQFENLFQFQKEKDNQIATEKALKIEAQEKTAVLAEKLKGVATCQKSLADTNESLEQAKKILLAILGDRLLREYRTEKETLLRELAFLKRISALEDYRKKLEDGKPCPLCGASSHPFAAGNIPEKDETEKSLDVLSKLIEKAEKQETKIQNLEKRQQEAQVKLTESEKLVETAATEKKITEKSLADHLEAQEKNKTAYKAFKLKILTKLKPLGIAEFADSELTAVLKSLQERLQKWQEYSREKESINKKITEYDQELSRLRAVIETQENMLKEKSAELEVQNKEYQNQLTARKALFGVKSPDEEEACLKKVVTLAVETAEQKKADQDKVLNQLNNTQTTIADLKSRIEKEILNLDLLETKFEISRQAEGFKSEDVFLAARMEPALRLKLDLQAQNLDKKELELKTRKKDREDRYNTEIAKKITDKSLEELAPLFKTLEIDLKTFRDEIAALTHSLKENGIAKEKIKEKQIVLEKQQKECRRWEKLHVLIGSADGKKFRNFAQGLTFEIMVSHANRQLSKMTDRYLLIRAKDQPLELNVVDNYQGGEIRSTRNLSGGESFIVSLTLALGLSKMASKKVRVDSLFLDEGFGSLDEEALETALETLSGLQQDGKLIGIISHVSALKERISTQIAITTLSGGRSELEGPGCNKI